MENLVAVLSSNLERTMQWIQEKYEVEKFNWVERRFHLKDGRILVIIQDHQQALSWEFSNYIKAPDYFTLEDTVQSRLRKPNQNQNQNKIKPEEGSLGDNSELDKPSFGSKPGS